MSRSGWAYYKISFAGTRKPYILLASLQNILYNNVTPVSYTHLDVYKRQLNKCV